MKPRVLGRLLMAAALAAGSALASTPTDADLAKSVRHEVLMYSRYTIWDDISFRVSGGNVELLGAVSQPYKKQDISRIVQSIPGVTGVTNELKVLPLSAYDDRLRLMAARAIFSDPVLSRYAMGGAPSIHIIVDNGHVTLAGTVGTEMDRRLAGLRVAGLGFGAVENQLTVDQPSKAKKG